MESITEHHRYLFLGKITDSLSESEEEELQQLFASNRQAEKEYHDFVATLPKGDVSNSFKRVRQPDFWKNHLPGEIVRQRKSFRRKVFSGISILLVLCVGAVIYFRSQPGEKLLVAAVEKPRVIQLKLANGEMYDLNQQKGTINSGEFNFTNENGLLEYKNNSSDATGINSITVPVSMTYRVNLIDGSRIWMNSATQLDFPSNFGADKREIRLSGEAYLEIAKDAKRPFIVKLPNSTVEVTGTVFNVNTYDSLVTKVALVEGGVNLAAANNKLMIRPGTQGIYDQSAARLYTEPFNANKTLGWRQGLFYFERASLGEIAQVLFRWYGVKTVIERKELSSKRFAGILNKNESIEVFLDNLRNITRIETFFDKDGVLHFR